MPSGEINIPALPIKRARRRLISRYFGGNERVPIVRVYACAFVIFKGGREILEDNLGIY